MHAPPQQHHCQCPLAVPQDAVPPLAHEVEVEMAVVDVVKETAVSFKDLVQVPVRERPTTIRKRLKPPSMSFTSDEHFAYVQGKGKGKGPKPKPNPKKKKEEPCTICHHAYGDRDDPKSAEEWLCCVVCSHWYHETCAEDNGVIDDDGTLTCKECLFPNCSSKKTLHCKGCCRGIHEEVASFGSTQRGWTQETAPPKRSYLERERESECLNCFIALVIGGWRLCSKISDCFIASWSFWIHVRRGKTSWTSLWTDCAIRRLVHKDGKVSSSFVSARTL
ncbi:uncharacterized protein LOC131537591 [Onychostoma macrolepis]|uniref:uncharacterized protein LOC131537591 n=1 Tax=Onychostoma macrolepis TaxID=369639 RepID=UPI00272CA9C8|nr:uncharacterized protein LOC131537591 [Onychostoma macrolepis]